MMLGLKANGGLMRPIFLRCDQVREGVTICHHMKFVTVEVGMEFLCNSPLQSGRLTVVGRVLAFCIMKCSAFICNDSGSTIL